MLLIPLHPMWPGKPNVWTTTIAYNKLNTTTSQLNQSVMKTILSILYKI